MSPEVLAALVGLVAGGGAGFFWGQGTALARVDAAVDEALRAKDRERELSAQLVELVSQMTRMQRAMVGLPEIAAPGLKERQHEEPPEEIVHYCAYFENAGPKMLKQAQMEHRKGIPWSYVIEGIKRSIGEQSPEALDRMVAAWESKKRGS